MPETPVIKNSNSLALMRPDARSGEPGKLARFPLLNSHTVIPSGHWETNMSQHEVDKMDVSLITSNDGSDRIAINIASALQSEDFSSLTLTPSQARILATELISAVNRAEVKRSLKTSPNLWRRQGEARPRLASA